MSESGTDSIVTYAPADRWLPELDMGLFQNMVPYYYLNMLGDKDGVVCRKSYPASDKDAMLVENDVADAMDAHPELKGVGGFAAYPMTGRDLKGYYSQGYAFIKEAFIQDYGAPDFFKTNEVALLIFPGDNRL